MTQYVYTPDEDGSEKEATTLTVTLCSGSEIPVANVEEQEYFDKAKAGYLAAHRFTEVTDLQDLDRLLGLELMMFRCTHQLAKGYDYDGNVTDDEALRKAIKENSDLITKVKISLGIDKKSRDAALNDGNFHTWFMDVKRRAKIFGIHRENQLNVGIGLLKEISGVIGAFDRSDEEERKKLGHEDEKAIIDWIRGEVLPKFHEVDEYFLEHEQKLWKRDL